MFSQALRLLRDRMQRSLFPDIVSALTERPGPDYRLRYVEDLCIIHIFIKTKIGQRATSQARSEL